METEVLSLKELASYLGMTYQEAYRLVHRGEIPASKDGNRLYVLFSDAERWLDEKTRPEV